MALKIGTYARLLQGEQPIVQVTGGPRRGWWVGFEVVTGRERDMLGALLMALPADAPEVVTAVERGLALEAETPTIDDQLQGRAARCACCDTLKVAARLDGGLCAACGEEKREQEERDRNDEAA